MKPFKTETTRYYIVSTDDVSEALVELTSRGERVYSVEPVAIFGPTTRYQIRTEQHS